MREAIALNQYNFQPQQEIKKSSRNRNKGSSESSFAEKMRAAQSKDNKSDAQEKFKEIEKSKTSKQESVKAVDSSKKENSKSSQLPSEKDTKKMLEETAEEAAVQLAQLDLSSIEENKLNSLLRDAGLLEASGDDLISKAAGTELEFSKLNTADLKALISNLENLISNSEIDLAENDQLASLLNLLKEVDSEKNISIENQAFREKFADYFDFQVQAESKADKTSSIESNEQVQTAGAEKQSLAFINSDQNKLSQKVDFEQKTLAQNKLGQEKTAQNTENNHSKNEQLSKLFSSPNQKQNIEFDSKLIFETAKADNTADKKVVDFNFLGTDSSLNTKLNVGEKSNNFVLDQTQLKGEMPVKDQFVQQFKGEFSAAKNEMNIELKPESLGKIEVKLNLNDGKIDAKMLVENKLVQTQLESSMQEIKSDLIKQGINIEQFKIETAKVGPRQVEQQNEFNLNDQKSAFSDGETGQNQEYEQRQFFQGQYYVQRSLNKSGLDNLDGENLVMRQQEIINRAAFSKGKLNLIV